MNNLGQMNIIFDIFEEFSPEKNAERSNLLDSEHYGAPNRHFAEIL